jgi:lysozyme
MTYGCDVSAYQPGSPAWGPNKFAWVKATEGVGWVSPVWRAQIASARAAGLGTGYYHFCDGRNTPQAEAQFYWNTIKDVWQPGEPIALDVEGPFFNYVADPVGWVLACAQELFALSGLKAVFYSDWSHVKGRWNWQPLVEFDMGLWGAAYNPVGFGDPSPWPAIFCWQNADTNETGGDSNQLNGDLTTWRAYGTPAGQPAINPQSTNVTANGDTDMEYKDWSIESKKQHYCDMWGLPGGTGGDQPGLPGAPLLIDRETNQGAWPETHLAALRQRLDASLGGAIAGVATAVKAIPSAAPAAGPASLTAGDIDAIANKVADLLAKRLEA